MAPRKLAAGNWKMNGTRASMDEIAVLLATFQNPGCDILICPPATLILPMSTAAEGSPLRVGGQDCSALKPGAHTGDIAASQLADAGATHVILGHSERRADHGETNADVSAKAVAAHQAGLIAVICVGETEAQRDGNETLDIISSQLAQSVPPNARADNTVIAYEPVWAIGTGRTPTIEQIAEVHDLMRAELSNRFDDGADFSLLYGGSVKPGNAAEIFTVANVNGALVGGASLTAADFGPIIDALQNS